MKTDNFPDLYKTPLMIWNQLVWGAGQMTAESIRSITRSTGYFIPDAGLSGSLNSDTPQMMQEKTGASAHSAQAMVIRLFMLNQQFASIAFRQMLSTASVLMSITGSSPVAEAPGFRAKPVQVPVVATARPSRAAIKHVTKRGGKKIKKTGK